MASEHRLDGRRIAVTRGKQGEDALSSSLRRLGAELLEVPSIVTAPPASFAELDQALDDLATFDWIVFASTTAVHETLARLESLGLPRAALARPQLAAVGPATAERLARALRPPDLVPAEARGEALAAALAPQVHGRRVLVPRAADGRHEILDGLAQAGADVVAATAYRTIPAPPEAVAPLADALDRGEVDAVTFASPSAVKSVVSSLGSRAGDLLGRTVIAVIGPTTADAVRTAGLAVGVQPAEASAAALAEAVAAAIGPRRLGGNGDGSAPRA